MRNACGRGVSLFGQEMRHVPEVDEKMVQHR